MNKIKLTLSTALLSFILIPNIYAQEKIENENTEAKTQKIENQAPNPIDLVVQHINNMNQIIEDELDNPDTLITKINEYIQTNKKDMRKASTDFEKHMTKLPVDEAERYRETLQRKLEKPLEKFLTSMLSFQQRHPESAKKLDEILKEQL